VKLHVNHFKLLTRGKLIFVSASFCISLFAAVQFPNLGLMGESQAQTSKTAEKKAPQIRQKATISSNKSVGFKDPTAGKSSKSNSLNPELFKRKDAMSLLAILPAI